jgi:hypothetical protein
MPRGRQTLWGIPFRLGPKDLKAKGLLALGNENPKTSIPLKGTATHLCFLHFCNLPEDPEANTAGGEKLADYTLEYRDGTRHVQPIRRRFEINAFAGGWGHLAFGFPTIPPSTVGGPFRPVPEDNTVRSRPGSMLSRMGRLRDLW